MPALDFPSITTYPLSGTTAAQRPVLAGVVIHDELVELHLPISEKPIKTSCNIQVRVTRSFATGKLDFDYRIINLLDTPAFIERIELAGLGRVPGLELTFADFRPDGLGTIAPTTFRSGPPEDGEQNAFNRSYYFDFNQTIPPKGSSRFFFFSTNAANYTPMSLGFVFEALGGGRSDPGVELLTVGPLVTPTWAVTDLTTAAQVPVKATGGPQGFESGRDKTTRIVFVGTDGMVHEVWRGGAWRYDNISHATGNPPGPAGTIGSFSSLVDGAQRIVYRSGDGHIHVLTYDGSWHADDLTAAAGAPVAAGDPAGFGFFPENTNHVVYRGTDGHIHDLASHGSTWRHTDITAASDVGAKAAADPCAYIYPVDNTSHVVFVSTDFKLHELWYNGTWHAAMPTASIAAPARPTGYYFPKDRTQHIIFRDGDNIPTELWYNGTWHMDALENLPPDEGPDTVASDLIGYALTTDDSQRIVFRSKQNDVVQIFFRTNWTYEDLSQAVVTTAAPAAQGAPCAYEDLSDKSEHVVYTSAAGDLIELRRPIV